MTQLPTISELQAAAKAPDPAGAFERLGVKVHQPEPPDRGREIANALFTSNGDTILVNDPFYTPFKIACTAYPASMAVDSIRIYVARAINLALDSHEPAVVSAALAEQKPGNAGELPAVEWTGIKNELLEMLNGVPRTAVNTYAEQIQFAVGAFFASKSAQGLRSPPAVDLEGLLNEVAKVMPWAVATVDESRRRATAVEQTIRRVFAEAEKDFASVPALKGMTVEEIRDGVKFAVLKACTNWSSCEVAIDKYFSVIGVAAVGAGKVQP